MRQALLADRRANIPEPNDTASNPMFVIVFHVPGFPKEVQNAVKFRGFGIRTVVFLKSSRSRGLW